MTQQTESKVYLWRIRHNVSLRELGRRIGCSGGSISRLENGKFNPSARLVQKLMAETGLTMEEILG